MFQFDNRIVILVFVTICCLKLCFCDSGIYNGANAKYNQLLRRDYSDLSKKISEQLPKQAKFFDINDFDRK